MLLNPEKALETSAQQEKFGSPVTNTKTGIKEKILSTTAGYIATICVFACFFVVTWLSM